MELVTFLKQGPDGLEHGLAKWFADAWAKKVMNRGHRLISQGDGDLMEYVLLGGRAASLIADADGREVCVGLHVGPCVIPPNLARTRDGCSLISLDILEDCAVACMPAAALSEMMLASVPVRAWANWVLRAELSAKVDREWCLAALGGSARLAWFRAHYPQYEDMFQHRLIATFLGLTAVTFSRLRAQADAS